jgi:hypothetical protein
MPGLPRERNHPFDRTIQPLKYLVRAGLLVVNTVLLLALRTHLTNTHSVVPDNERQTVERLKQAGYALDAATKASKQTVKEVSRAKRAVTAAKKKLLQIDSPPKRKPRRKRRPKTAT